jgi:hypothetical protein
MLPCGHACSCSIPSSSCFLCQRRLISFQLLHLLLLPFFKGCCVILQQSLRLLQMVQVTGWHNMKQMWVTQQQQICIRTAWGVAAHVCIQCNLQKACDGDILISGRSATTQRTKINRKAPAADDSSPVPYHHCWHHIASSNSRAVQTPIIGSTGCTSTQAARTSYSCKQRNRQASAASYEAQDKYCLTAPSHPATVLTSVCCAGCQCRGG